MATGSGVMKTASGDEVWYDGLWILVLRPDELVRTRCDTRGGRDDRLKRLAAGEPWEKTLGWRRRSLRHRALRWIAHVPQAGVVLIAGEWWRLDHWQFL